MRNIIVTLTETGCFPVIIGVDFAVANDPIVGIGAAGCGSICIGRLPDSGSFILIAWTPDIFIPNAAAAMSALLFASYIAFLIRLCLVSERRYTTTCLFHFA
jgi:hypothetical protein